MIDSSTELRTRDRFAFGLFWSWNLIFVAFMTLGFAPRLIPELVLAVRTGAIPASFLLYALVLTAVPIAAIILGLTKLRRAPTRLFALGYVVEGPLMLLLAVRFFLIREANPAMILILIIAGIGMLTFLWYVLDPSVEKRNVISAGLRLFGLTLMLIISLYAAVWIAFYAVPLISIFFQWLGETLADLPRFFSALFTDLGRMVRDGLIWVPFTVLGFLLLLFTGTLFALTPLAVPYLSGRAWWRSLIGMVEDQGWSRPLPLVIVTLLACAGLFIQTNRQPQHQAFALLESPPASAVEAQMLLERSDAIRAGLLNAYLAPFRYISSVGEVVHVRRMYRDTFKMSDVEAYAIQNLYEQVANPLLYKPALDQPLYEALQRDNFAFQREPEEAARLYQSFFDQTIVQGERQQIVQAVRNTWSQDQAEAAWGAVDDIEIYLLRQEVRISEFGDWADVELFEVYQNQTTDLQEVIYYFNLPESAVLTGVWLGNTPDRSNRFEYQIAPRGAAQAVYRNETRVMRDPALLEQIGPRQYRLRVYPVMPLRISWDANRARSTVQDGPPLYMWMTYRTLASEDGWPMPSLAVKRNVFWDGDTERLLNGSTVVVDEDAWLPATVPALEPVTPRAHHVLLPGNQVVMAVPISQATLPSLPVDLRLAVVLDRSRSMAEHADQVTEELIRLREWMGPEAVVDVYLTSSPYRGEPPIRVPLGELDLDTIMYFGGQNAAQLLAQFEELRSDRAYDSVLVLTDGSGYELGESQVEVPVSSAPVWMVHLGSDIPLGYDDDTLAGIQSSGGGVVGQLDDALSRMAVAMKPEGETSEEAFVSRDLLDGYIWTVLSGDEAGALAIEPTLEDPGFNAFAARRLILAEMQRQRGDLDQLDTLDFLHALAQEYSIVTPYSSMIVLVNAEQRQLLENLEGKADRFQREFEDLTDTVPSTPQPLTGVPEPHEWLLIGLAVVMLLWVASRQRVAWQSSNQVRS